VSVRLTRVCSCGGTAEDSLTPAHTSEKRWAAQTGGPVSVRLTRVCSCGGGER